MDISWKVVNGLTLAGAAIVANLVVKNGWKLVTGHKPPTEGEEELQARMLEVLAFGAISGLVMAATRRFALGKANQWYGGSKFNQLEV
ncbi:DUF4235 domain-containing protein [Boudabousia marimammalium]|uniref:DUF4235 domain-containing protein n=1 Tax=Boudabousia marimammalium TaxID=156892 RepID=A0A1Q5PMG6_9ACTO|nr:DUF4235 domain-containing protein [Boudabousia marimammalium]OKL48726.1 hypothetical protein BM477_05900 [Boudabousia marimammalium]